MPLSFIRTAAIIGLVSASAMPAMAQINFNDRGDYYATGAGAVVGGAIGSNLAGGGVQDEGTAIGAVLGGAVGNYLYNQATEPRFSNGYYGGQNYGQPYYGQGYPAPAQNYGYGYPSAPIGYSGSSRYGDQGYSSSSRYGDSRYGDYYEGGASDYEYGEYYYYGGNQSVAAQPALPPVTYQHMGYVAGPIITQTYRAPVVQKKTRVVCVNNNPCPTYRSISSSSSVSTTSSSSLSVVSRPTTVTSTITVAPCPTGTTKQADGTCLSHKTTRYTPPVTTSSCGHGSSVHTIKTSGPSSSSSKCHCHH